MRSLKVAGAAVLLLASVSARAFVRETVHDSNGNDTGIPIYWKCRNVPFAINEQGTRAGGQGCTAEEAIAAVKAGFFAWPSATLSGQTQACTDFQFNYQGTTSRSQVGYVAGSSDDANLVVWRQGLCTQSADDPCHKAHNCGNVGNCWDYGNAGTIALTTTTYAVSSGQIVHADMEFYSWDGSGAGSPINNLNGWYFTCSGASTVCTTSGQASCSYIDLQNTATHEAGHVVGLDHELMATATMNPTAPPGELSKRVLADDDVNGICAIYPKGSGTNDCSVSASTCGYGAGAGGAAGVLASLLAGLAVRRRRARCV